MELGNVDVEDNYLKGEEWREERGGEATRHP